MLDSDKGDALFAGLCGVVVGKVLELIVTGVATAYIGVFAAQALMILLALISIYLAASFVLSLRESPSLSSIAYFIGMALGYFVLGDAVVFVVGVILAVGMLILRPKRL